MAPTDPNGIPGKVRQTQQTFEFLIQDVLRGSWFKRLVFLLVVFAIFAHPSLLAPVASAFIGQLPHGYKTAYEVTLLFLALATLIVGSITLPKKPNPAPTQADSAVVPQGGPPLAGPSEIAAGPALPDITKIRLKPECEGWKEIGVGNGEFERQTELEFAEDPVFEITVQNNCRSTLMLYEAGIRLLRREPGKGGGGCAGDWEHRTKRVQNELIVRCPDDWKRAQGVIEDRISTASKPFAQPIEMNKDGSRYLFTLKLQNFVDTNSSSSSEVRFYLVTENNRLAESRSLWLHQ